MFPITGPVCERKIHCFPSDGNPVVTHQWIPHTKGQLAGECVYIMLSSGYWLDIRLEYVSSL